MNREETYRLYSQGVEAWNEWASDMLAQQQALREAELWQLETSNDSHLDDLDADLRGKTAGGNDETRRWLEAARADFRGVSFPSGADFRQFTFPGVADFSGELMDRCVRPVVFEKTARFEGAIFMQDAIFSGAMFNGAAIFKRCQFHGIANFHDVEFDDSGGFIEAVFHGVALFDDASFKGNFGFPRAVFKSLARFRFGNCAVGKCPYRAGISFARARFEGNANFYEFTFATTANFSDVIFLGDLRFVRVEGHSGIYFSNARFEGNADFSCSTLAPSPTLREIDAFDTAHFNDVVFSGDFRFERVQVKGSIFLTNARIVGDAKFCGTTFENYAGFDHVIFEKSCRFQDAHFRADANFKAVEFNRLANMEGARVDGQAIFSDLTELLRLRVGRRILEDPA